MVCWGQKWHYAPLIIKLTKVQAERSPMSWIDDLIFLSFKISRLEKVFRNYSKFIQNSISSHWLPRLSIYTSEVCADL
ncbi:hypothetical protein DRX19_27505 [Salmonella enterica subsp. enterica]|nr:hypothetical protein [Salmonella enterica subsp. enterica serovar Pensacola]